ncbi:hypothetical protein GALMADRAFT_153574 [Galerina marginata CBS 339.88]|uniref:Uncharacterized protein n=1 Tax=Galerina marginata (strain CBS 339.88) TaxID=685588 RepID=A0A067TLG5_GALM3|nr:hypothetical protein GALMADRAFT_153574 [Galerina marginata CBS 339.88]
MEALPVYVEDEVPQSPFDALVTRIAAPISSTHPDARVILESYIESQKAPAYDRPQEIEAPKPIDHYPSDDGPNADLLTRVKQQIVRELFDAIAREDSETILLLIQNNLVTANTTRYGRTPLLEGISTKIIHVVKELLDLGADPNAFGVVHNGQPDQATRTPLMFAASIGSLPIVKLLFEPPYNANDALVAPDGEIALRLAAAAGHRAIVEYLPSRRAGGFLRWKTHHALAVGRMKKAFKKIYAFIKFFVWDVPEFFVWSIPKHVVVLPIVRSCKWCWGRRKQFGAWCKHQVTETPKRIARAGRWVWKEVKKVPAAVAKAGKWAGNGLKKVPAAIKATGKWVWKFITETLPKWIKDTVVGLWKIVKDIAKELWKFGTETLPRWIKNVVLWFWELLTQRIPRAIFTALKWVWAGFTSLAKATWNVIEKLMSLVHTLLQAVVNFLRNVKLVDIWNGFREVLRAIFITFPAMLWSWVEKFGEASYKIMESLFGLFGEIVWWIFYGLKWLIFYVPGKFWVILEGIGSSLAKASHEILVWISPKA